MEQRPSVIKHSQIEGKNLPNLPPKSSYFTTISSKDCLEVFPSLLPNTFMMENKGLSSQRLKRPIDEEVQYVHKKFRLHNKIESPVNVEKRPESVILNAFLSSNINMLGNSSLVSL